MYVYKANETDFIYHNMYKHISLVNTALVLVSHFQSLNREPNSLKEH